MHLESICSNISKELCYHNVIISIKKIIRSSHEVTDLDCEHCITGNYYYHASGMHATYT